MSDDDVARAIATIEESRSTHVMWAEHQETYPDWQAHVDPGDVGDPEHHRKCIAEYDHVLAVLRSIPAPEPARSPGWGACHGGPLTSTGYVP